jgi:L-seryl-tRNA(Ser) seleniumtransferase
MSTDSRSTDPGSAPGRDAQAALLRAVPAVGRLLASPEARELLSEQPRQAVVNALRAATDAARSQIASGAAVEMRDLAPGVFVAHARRLLEDAGRPSLRPVINATGVVIHTGLGRSVMSERAALAVYAVARQYNNLEVDLQTGKRGSRHAHVERILCEITGAPAAAVFNNNAAATLLMLNALADGREVIVSRGQLVEIGGSFRLPDVMARSGCRLVEVGTTNRTHLRDYEAAINENTAAILRAHHSNYRIIGFTTEPGAEELAQLCRERGIAFLDDIGSGALLDFSQFGLRQEPLVHDSVAAGANIVCFSGDKLLGGPQCGIILGDKEHVGAIKKNPLARAFRVGKMTIAALEATLRSHADPETAIREIPTLQIIAAPLSDIRSRARKLRALVRQFAPPWVSVEMHEEAEAGRIGGGSLPEETLPTVLLALTPTREAPVSLDELTSRLRTGRPAVMARIHEGALQFDLRTVFPDQVKPLSEAIRGALT